MIIRTLAVAAAALVLTTGAVAALANTDFDSPQPKITINRTGEFCLTYDPLTGTRIPHTECHSKAIWAEMGVTFGRR